MDATTRQSMTTRPIACPRGVTRGQRRAFLALDEEQKATYRYYFDTEGRPAGLALRLTLDCSVEEMQELTR